MAQKATGDPKQHADHADTLHKKTVDEIEHFPVNLPIQGDRKNLAYPAEFYKKDPREEKLHLLRQVASDWHKEGFQVALPDEVLDYFVQKKKYVEFENWEKWVQDNFDLKNPSEVARLKQIMPEYFGRRLEYLKKLLGLAYTVHKLKLLGPESETDMMLLYELEKGEVPIPNITIDKEGDETGQFDKGFFNIRKWLGSEGDMKRPDNLGSAPWNKRTPSKNVESAFGRIFETRLDAPFKNNPWKTLTSAHKEYASIL
jgi:hypothetical protein